MLTFNCAAGCPACFAVLRYAGSKETEIQLLLYCCFKLKQAGIPINRSVMISNLYNGQVKKIDKILPTLHEDLQYDYRKEAEFLNF